MKLKKFFTSSNVIGILSFLIGVTALVAAIVWNKKLNNETAYISNETAKLSENTNELGKTVQIISRNLENLPNRSVKPYPGNIDDIIRDIFCYCDNNPNAERIEIYTDFIAYGILSDNIKWNDYWEKIKSIIEQNKDITVNWYYYNNKLRNEHINKQFACYANDSKRFDAFLNQCKNRIKENNRNCDQEMVLINSITNIHTLEYNLVALLGIKENKVKSLKENNRNLKYNPINNIFPFHAWFVFERGTDSNTPVRGIITFPSYPINEKESTERGIFTTNQEILNVLYSIIKDNVKQN